MPFPAPPFPRWQVSHPLARGCLGAWVPGVCPDYRDLATIPDLTRQQADATLDLGSGTITTAQAASAYGWTFEYTNTSAFSGSKLALPSTFATDLGESTQPDFTIFLLASWGVSKGWDLFHHHSGTFGNQFYLLSAGLSSIVFRFDANRTISYSSSLAAGQMYRMAFRKSGTEFSVWADGALIGSTTVGASITGDDSQEKRITLPTTNGRIGEMRIHNVPFSDDEIALDAFDPFAPYRVPAVRVRRATARHFRRTLLGVGF